MTWHFCVVYRCNNSVREQVACERGYKQNSLPLSCGHPPKRPDLVNVIFHPFPVEPTLKIAWYVFLRRKDLKFSDVSRNPRVCCLFQIPLVAGKVNGSVQRTLTVVTIEAKAISDWSRQFVREGIKLDVEG